MSNLELLLKELAKTTLECLERPSTSNKIEEPSDAKFYVGFFVDTEGNLDFKVGWPNSLLPIQIVNAMSVLLHQISSGTWKPVMTQGVQAEGLNKGQTEVAQAIITRWANLISTQGADSVCVDPTEVFKG